MNSKDIETIKRLLMSSNPEDHMVGLTLLTKNRGVRRLTAFFDKVGTDACLTIDRLSHKAWVLNNQGTHNYNYYEGKKASFYVSQYVVYLVKPKHPHGIYWPCYEL